MNKTKTTLLWITQAEVRIYIFPPNVSKSIHLCYVSEKNQTNKQTKQATYLAILNFI